MAKKLNTGVVPIQSETPGVPAGNNRAGAMASIIRTRRNQTRKDIQAWQLARLTAESPDFPNRARLMDLYADAVLDAHLASAMNQRVLRQTNKPFRLVGPDGEQNPDATSLLEHGWFRKLLRMVAESDFWGASLMEPLWANGRVVDVLLIPRQHVLPDRFEFLQYPSDQMGTSFLSPPYADSTLFAGSQLDLGLLLPLSLLAIYKKNTWASWGEFEEIFGVPLRIAKMASLDPRAMAETERWLQEMGTAAYGLFPMGTELEVHPSGQSDAFRVFEEKRKACNEEISKLINGQTMTADGGSSRSQSETHERTQEQITRDDLRARAFWINDTLLPYLRKYGYPIAEDEKFVWDEQEQLSVEEKFKIHMGLLQYYEIDETYLSDLYDTPITGVRTAQAASGQQSGKEKPTDKPKARLFI